MSKTVTKEEVVRIAGLANIKLTETEIEKFSKQITDILGYVEKLSELNIDIKEYKSQTTLSNVFRDDKPKDSLKNSDATLNRKDSSKNGYIVIKGVLNK